VGNFHNLTDIFVGLGGLFFEGPIKLESSKAKIVADSCVDCGVCVGECPVEAICME